MHPNRVPETNWSTIDDGRRRLKFGESGQEKTTSIFIQGGKSKAAINSVVVVASRNSSRSSRVADGKTSIDWQEVEEIMGNQFSPYNKGSTMEDVQSEDNNTDRASFSYGTTLFGFLFWFFIVVSIIIILIVLLIVCINSSGNMY